MGAAKRGLSATLQHQPEHQAAAGADNAAGYDARISFPDLGSAVLFK